MMSGRMISIDLPSIGSSSKNLSPIILPRIIIILPYIILPLLHEFPKPIACRGG